MSAVITVAAANVGPDNDAVTDPQRNAFKIRIGFIATDCGDGSDVFMSLNDREGNRPGSAGSAILPDVSLVGVLVRSANARDFHLHEQASGRGFGQRILTNFVASGFHECCRENSLGRHTNLSCSLFRRGHRIWSEKIPGTRKSPGVE